MKQLQLGLLEVAVIYRPCAKCEERAGEYELCMMVDEYHGHLHYCKPCIIEMLGVMTKFVNDEEETPASTPDRNLN